MVWLRVQVLCVRLLAIFEGGIGERCGGPELHHVCGDLFTNFVVVVDALCLCVVLQAIPGCNKQS